MPNYLVELPAGTPVSNMSNGTVGMVVFAEAVVIGTDLVDAGDVAAWSAFARISGGAAQTVDPIIADVNAMNTDPAAGRKVVDRFHVGSVALNDGGTATYIIDDILSAAGGTLAAGGRAATFRVITVSTGVILTVELVDPGDYTVAPPTLVANPVTGGGGTGALLDLTMALEGSLHSLLARLTTDLGLFADLTPALDLSDGAAGARLLTLAVIGDDVGDAAIEVEIRHNGTPETVLLSTIVDEGIAAAVLTIALQAKPFAPPRIRVYQ